MQHSTAYSLGFLCGILAVALICLLVRKLLKNKKNSPFDMEYDERQKLAQGVAAKHALYGLMGWLALDGVVSYSFYDWAAPFTHLFIALLIGAVTYAVACIRREAYVGFRNSARSYFWLLISLAVLNLVLFFFNLSDTPLVQDGMVQPDIISLLCSVALLVICLTWKLHDCSAREEQA